MELGQTCEKLTSSQLVQSVGKYKEVLEESSNFKPNETYSTVDDLFTCFLAILNQMKHIQLSLQDL